jgi:hypothetical protein
MGGQDTFENTLFRLTTPKGFILVLVYVDDLLVAAHNEQEGADFLQKLTGIWKIKLTGKIPALRRGVLQLTLGENHLSGKGWGIYLKSGGE